VDLENYRAAAEAANEALEVVITLEPERTNSGAIFHPPLDAALDAVGYLVGHAGDARTGLLLRGAADRVRADRNEAPLARRAALAAARAEKLRAQLDPADAEAAWAAGRELEHPEEVARRALDALEF
jgi:hypothetical protein